MHKRLNLPNNRQMADHERILELVEKKPMKNNAVLLKKGYMDLDPNPIIIIDS